jgi:hypothetical protein
MLASYYIKGKIEKEVSPNVHTQKKFNKNKISKVCAWMLHGKYLQSVIVANFALT